MTTTKSTTTKPTTDDNLNSRLVEIDDNSITIDIPNKILNIDSSKSNTNGNKNDNTNKSTDPRPILVLVNPHSGRGKSLKIYTNWVSKFLNSHNIPHEVFVTTREIRVREYLCPKSLDELQAFRCILIVSGDGLVYETVNAVMSRPDWQQVMQIPLAIIPTGSGNGLAYTLMKQSTGPKSCQVKSQEDAIQFCCDQAVQSETCQSDLVRIQYGLTSETTTTIWSFLSIGWGLLADIDVDSDWLRRLGELRFTIYGLIRSLTSKSRRGRLSYQLDDAKQHQQQVESTMKSSGSSCTLQLDGQHSGEGELESSRATNGTSSTTAQDNWIHIEDKFACLYAVHQSHISRTTKFAPKSTPTDSLIYLTYVRGKLSPCRVVEFLLAIEDGSHEKLSYVNVIPVSKFKFQPLEPSKIVIDGEVTNWDVTQGPLLAEVVPKVLTLNWRKDC